MPALVFGAACGWMGPRLCPAQPVASPDLAEIQPLLPPGISDFNLELFGKLAYTWNAPDGARVVEILGNFSGRMGPWHLRGHDAVLWVTRRTWQDRAYLDCDVFLWQEAEVIQPGGTIDSGPVLLVTLRTFGRLALNADGHAARSDEGSDLFREATRARGLLTAAPAVEAEKSDAPVRVAPSAERRGLLRPRPVKKVDFSAARITSEDYAGQTVILALEDVFVSQGSPSKSGEYVEIHADAAVLFLRKEKISGALPDLLGGRERKPPRARPGALNELPVQPSPAREPTLTGREDTDREAAADWVKSVYLEGDVVLSRGQRMIRASKLYYDFAAEQALILDAVMRALEPSRNLPIYVRAEKVRQLSATEYRAERAQFTTSEFHTPHISIGAERLDLVDRTPRNEAGDITGIQAGTYQARHTTLRMDGLPIAYWPFARGDFSEDRMAFRSARFGYNGDFGATVETRWYLFNLLGLQAPEGYDATLKLDYFTDRGPAAGIDMDYEQDNAFGLLRTYYINDGGTDELGPERSGDPPHENRGRATWRHRHLLPGDWQLSLEASYLSDRNFLEQYERAEFENGKDQETLAYLLRRRDNWQFSTLLNYRINEFLTQTEHLPDAAFSLIGEPLGEFATLYSESRAGVVRYRPDNGRFFNGQNRRDHTGETSSVLRGDTREEIQVPLPELGPLKLTPYVAGRGSAYDDGPSGRDEDNTSGGLGRVFGAYGLRGNMVASRVDDSIESDLLDLHRLRHVVKPDFSLWNAHGNRSPEELTPFDAGIEDTDDFGGGTVGVRQRFQTRRGGPGYWRTVDWIILDVEAGFFSDSQPGENTHGDYVFSRPEDSISSNFLATNFQYRLSDTTVLVHDNVFDLNNGNLGTSNLSLAVEREPRLAYFVGWRYIHDTESNILALGGNYRLSEKHILSVREMYDIDQGRNLSTEVAYIRRWPRWYTAIALDVDKALDDVGVNFSVWPEGAPRLGLGSKRYTGLADSVGLKLR